MSTDWKIVSWAECPKCGSEAEVLSECSIAECVYDGEDARCTECGLPGCVTVEDDGDGDGLANIVWDDYE